MNKKILSAGLVAIGAAGLQLQLAHADGVDSKAWSVSASLRGFYDDNYSTGPVKSGSYGVEFSPQIALSAPLTQTEIGLRYTYGLYYYQQREDLGVNPIDQSHQADLWVDHAFNERWHGKVADTFTYGSDPQLNNPGGGPNATFRVNGDNIANVATFSLNTDWTRTLSTEAIYTTKFYDYQNSGYNTNTQTASLAGELNRVDNSIELDLQYHIATETMAFVGYSFDQVNYTAGEMLGGGFKSDSRDNYSHFVYVGAQHNLLANLSVNARAGIQYNNPYNDPSISTSVTPYADLSAIYTYLPGSYAQIGFTHQLNSTEWIGLDLNTLDTRRIAQNQESSVLYASINHHITPKLLGTLIGQWQNSTYNGGIYDSSTENDYSLGLNLNYAFTRHFSGELGYNYDDLKSSVPGYGYTRNRVYVGIDAAY